MSIDIKFPLMNFQKFPKPHTENIVFKKHDKYKYHIAMFSNVVWGSNIRDIHNIFDSFIDWSVSTINYKKNRKDIKLYIKLHPAELYQCRNTPRFQDLIEKRVNLNEFENMFIIPKCFLKINNIFFMN